MNLNGGRRARSCNFTPEETERLVSLVAEYRNVIENKTKDAATWQAKQNAWVALMTEYNKSGGTFRDLVHVKMKYEALKRDARKKCQILMERHKAGERVDKAMLLTPLEKKVLNMAMPTEGGETSNGSEQPAESIVQLASEGGETSNGFEQPVDSIVQLASEGGETSNGSVQPDSNSVSEEVAEPPTKRIKVEQEEEDHLASTSEQVDQNIAESANENGECDPQEQASLQSEEHPAPCQPEKSTDSLSDEELEISALKKTILQEELQEKRLKRQMMEHEMQHKNELHKLAKAEILLKIEILKTELANKKKL